MTVVRTCYAFGLVFTICALGQQLSQNFEEIADLFEQYDWYLFTEEINRILLTIITILQRSIAIECFGSLEAGHEAYKKVSSIRKTNQKNKKNYFYKQIHNSKSISDSQYGLFIFYGPS